MISKSESINLDMNQLVLMRKIKRSKNMFSSFLHFIQFISSNENSFLNDKFSFFIQRFSLTNKCFSHFRSNLFRLSNQQKHSQSFLSELFFFVLFQLFNKNFLFHYKNKIFFFKYSLINFHSNEHQFSFK
jgi:hypothetical protein